MSTIGQHKPIGEILIGKGLITREQLDKALDIQKDQPDDKVGEILISQGLVSLRDVLSAYAEQVLIRYDDTSKDEEQPKA